MLESNRCSIRQFKHSDWEEVAELFKNSTVRKYLGGIRSEESIQTLLEEMIEQENKSYYWIIREKYTDRFVGLVSLDSYHDGINTEISYQLLPEWWNKGLATEVITEVLLLSFNKLKLTKIMAETQSANKASCRLLEKVGMRLERTLIRFGKEQSVYTFEVSD